MITFTRAQIASLIATGVDFLVTIFLVRVLGWSAEWSRVGAAASGTICGGISHFLLSRIWVFRAQEQKWAHQLPRYGLVWIGNLVLNTSLFSVLTNYYAVNYVWAKVITAVSIAVLYNYTLHKRFVFKQTREGG